MKRSTWVSLVDAVAFVAFVFLVGTGVLLKFVLPPGSGRVLGHGGGGRGGGRPVALVWDMTRHEWGEIHFWLSVLFLVVVALHLLIHWRWILVSFKGRHPQESRLLAGLGLVAVVGILAVAVAPLLSPKKTVSRRELQQERAGEQPRAPGEGDEGREL
jgi:hypothetical protein